MKTIYFATGNPEKIQIAKAACAGTAFDVEPVLIKIDEIQGDDPELIVRDKARRAYEELGQPVVVSDDTWQVPALGGFPGPYMKAINGWFTADDWLRLMHDVEDRRIVLSQYLAYTDGQTTELFRNDIAGEITLKPRGTSTSSPSMEVVSLYRYKGKTMAEVFSADHGVVTTHHTHEPDAWHTLIEWLNSSSF